MPSEIAATAEASAGKAPADSTRSDLARMAPTLIPLTALLWYLFFIARGSVDYQGRIYFTLFDDAMISMRYAKTLVGGGGFAWNPGEVPIEGITNPLWALWMALIHLVPVPEGLHALLVSLSSAACLLGTAFGARVLARQLGAGPNLALVAMAVVAFYYPLAYWSLRGMETGVLGCLMMWSIALALRQLDAPTSGRAAALAAMAAALVLVRQDAIVFVAVVAGFACFNGSRRHVMTWGLMAGAAILALAVLTGFRLAYYGEWLPNTYYLKVTGVTAVERLQRGIESLFSEEMRGHLLVIVAVLMLSLPALLRLPRAMLVRMALPLTAFLAQIAYSVYVGGDVWEYLGYPNRYISIAMPGLLVLTLVLMQSLATALAQAATAENQHAGGLDRAGLGRLLLVSLVALLYLQTSAKHSLAVVRQAEQTFDYDRAQTQVGLCLREHTKPGTRIAYTWAGSMPYYADRHAIDMLGKMDATVARSAPQRDFVPGHNKWDYAHSIDAHKPDILLQFYGGKAADKELIAARGYVPIDEAWPCFANTFLVRGDVMVKR